MQKIISLFQRNYDGNHLVRDEIVPGAEWVIASEGVATRKWDGTAVMVRDGKLFARYDAKRGKTPPPDFEPAMDPDPITGHWAGWVPVKDQPQYKWHRLTFEVRPPLEDGTYELCGPHFQTNPEGFTQDMFVRHGEEILQFVPHTFAELREWFKGKDIEGIVWHHPDGRMVKIKKKDFDLNRKD